MKSLKIIYISVALLLLFSVFSVLMKPKSINWEPTFGFDDKSPYGLYIFSRLINQYFPDDKISRFKGSLYQFVSKNNKTVPSYSNNIIIVADKTDFTTNDIKDIEMLLDRGNNVIIASTYFGKLENKLGIRTELLRYYHNPTTRTEIEKIIYGAGIIDSANAIQLPFGNSYLAVVDSLNLKAKIVLEAEKYFPVLIKFELSRGSLYLLTLPYAFTNINLIDKDRRELAETVLSLIPNKRIVLIDYYSLKGNEKSPLKFIMSNISLTMAFYLLLNGIFIVMVFGLKRDQRIIPIWEKKRNTTLDFITSIARFSFGQKDNKLIAEKKIEHFYFLIRSKLKIHENFWGNDFKKIFLQKTGLDESEFDQLKSEIIKISNQSKVTDNSLSNFCNIIDKINLKVIYEQS